MERIEVNVQTGELQIIQLTSDEISSVQAERIASKFRQDAMPPVVDLQTQIATLTAELNALKLKVGE